MPGFLGLFPEIQYLGVQQTSGIVLRSIGMAI